MTKSHLLFLEKIILAETTLDKSCLRECNEEISANSNYCQWCGASIAILSFSDDERDNSENDTANMLEIDSAEKDTADMFVPDNSELLPTAIEFEYLDYTEFSEYWFNGVFRCGTDFDAGEYYILPLFGAGAIYDVCDSPNDFTWFNHRLLRKVNVEKGEYVNVASGGIMVPANEVDTKNWTKYGAFLVGKDVLAGDYKMEPVSDEYKSELYWARGVRGAYQLNDNNIDATPITASTLFQSPSYITLENGQYIIITNLRLTNVDVEN